MGKCKFLVLVDYQHGGCGFIVYAKSRDELEKALKIHSPDRGIMLIDNNIDEHPLVKYLGKNIDVYDLDKPSGLLQICITQSQRYFSDSKIVIP
ncbi:hypothetical protein FKG94_23990 [Exilibacterium tricleocarpae]|uniref:Uncharacterized protein n=1 Tax=Exilibacterium tricleocarpae TaxID=2591008 RepID=A0A545ST91_9GAMM|nr:hypothetical protein [Exilibacterium tricleocarpae]TQV68155.1 hypothetical protein FKG94_23990 [Exilibacterium tricleocarpae]